MSERSVTRRQGMLVRSAWMLWELPQNALGALTLVLARAGREVLDVSPRDDCVLVYTKRLGVSLGRYVFYSDGESRWFRRDPLMQRHELGHRVQSRRLGPLYLPLVGLPSVLRSAYAFGYREATGRRWRRYFDGYPENWADRLGGISRAERAAQQRDDP